MEPRKYVRKKRMKKVGYHTILAPLKMFHHICERKEKGSKTSKDNEVLCTQTTLVDYSTK